MVGITSYGAYIPWYRMNRKLIFEQLGWFNPANAAHARGEKAVANYDEDTITMAVAAALDCLQQKDRGCIDGLFLASTSLPFAERQNAVIASDALDCKAQVRTADFGGSTRAGTTALLAALDATDDARTIMICSAENRQAKPGSAQEYTYGDGAAALMTGAEDVIAEFKGSYSVSHDFIDYRRISTEKFVHTWEERWIREEGYSKIIPEAIKGLVKEYDLDIKDFSKIVIACPVTGALNGIARRIGAAPEQLQDTMIANVGDTGSALALMMFVAAMEEAKPGDKIMVVSYGSGSDALYFEVTDKIETARNNRKAIAGHLAKRNDINVYGKYLVYRNLLPLEIGIRGEEIAPTAMSTLGRDGKGITALIGSRCSACGTPQYPKQRVCVNPDCGAIDEMEDYRFSDKIGKLMAFTGDHLAFSWDPPQIYGLVDFEEGGRILLDLTDCSLDTVSVGMPVRMSFRRKYADPNRGYFGYFWKAVPATS
jgi:hydroxymethylglutaryl-CoA synthase